MNKYLPVVLIGGGIVIAAIAFFGYRSANKQSDVEALQQAILENQAAGQAAQASLAELRKQPVPVPAVCQPVKTGVFFRICETEPDEGQTPPPWNGNLSEAEQDCIVETFHATNRHAFKLRQTDYAQQPPSDMQIIYLACDVAAATLFDPDIGYGDADASAAQLLASFYAERASSHYGPERSY